MSEIYINYGAVLAAGVANMVVGILWYGPVFGNQWKRLMGFTDESIKSMKLTPLWAMVGGFITSLVMAFVLAHALVFASAYTNTSGITAGVMAGFWNWLGFVAPVTIGIFLWEGKPFRLWVLNAAYWLVALILMGIILALWV